MRSNNFVLALAAIGLLVVFFFNVSYSHPASYSNAAHAVNVDSEEGDNVGDYVVNTHYEQIDKDRQQINLKEQKQQLHKNLDKHLNLTYFSTSKAISTSTSTSDAISAASIIPFSNTAYIYKAEVPTPIDSEANTVANAAKLAATSTTRVSTEPSYTSNTTNYFNVKTENDEELSKKIIGSSVVTSVSVILNGVEPEFTDALGQKVPKPQPSLQVASPIDLLNPDRYEFYTFDEHGELVKRLMTMEEIQSIVANGDGEGPTIIHNGPIEDRDPEKNVQDIVNSVQSVLNKEVELNNKNTSTDGTPVLDTPDVSSSWSMILPAIFGNTGKVDIFPHQIPQQIFMTPDTEIIEASTMESPIKTTKKPKPSKRKPGQNRKPIATTTEMTPQVIQEELDSQESVYTGMQQYQSLAATMQNYDGISQLHMQPIYHKHSEIETSTRLALISNQEVGKKPVTISDNDSIVLNGNLPEKPVYVHHKPPHRVKKPNGSQTNSKQPQASKQKIKRKPTVTTTTTTSTPTSTITTANTIPLNPTTTWASKTLPSNTLTISNPTILTSNAAVSTKAPNKTRKRPTRHPVLSTTTKSGESTQNPHFTAENRKPSTKPQKQKPIQQYSIYPHQEFSHNNFQHLSNHKMNTKPTKPIDTTTTLIHTTAATPPSSTSIFSSFSAATTDNLINESLIVQEFPGDQQIVNSNEEAYFTIRFTTNKPESATSVNIPSSFGTSGYPVPSYAISVGESEHSGFSQYIKQPLASTTIIQHENKPYEHDTHALQSFDQIVQTLQQLEKITDRTTENISKISEKLNLHNVKNYSLENEDYFKQNYTKLRPSSTSKPTYDQYGGSLFATSSTEDMSNSDKLPINDEGKTLNTITTSQPQYNLKTTTSEEVTTVILTEKETNKNIDTANLNSFSSFINTTKEFTIFTDLPETTHVLSEKKMEQTTEYSIAKEPDTQESETPTYDSTSHIEQSTLANLDETATDENQFTKDYNMGHLKTETPLPMFLPYEKESMVNNYAKHPVLAADLKSQLNIEVIKPSEQIAMSYFQTQAATVASTLVDGIYTVLTDYSNDTGDEIALLMSAVIKQISNTTQINSDDNRYSNQAKLDLSFLMSPTKDDTQNLISMSPKTKYHPNYNQSYKPIYDRLQSTQMINQQSENLHENTTYFNTSEIPVTTLVETNYQEFDTETETTTIKIHTKHNEEEIGTPPHASNLDNLMTTTSPGSFADSLTETMTQDEQERTVTEISKPLIEGSDEYVSKSSIDKVKKKNENGSDNNRSTIAFDGNSITSPYSTESSEKMATYSDIYTQRQTFEDEREALFEADSSIDTTTFRNGLFKEVTSVSGEETINLEEYKIEKESVIDNSKNGSQTEIATLKDYFNEEAQMTTETSSETSEEKLNLFKIETTEGLTNFNHIEQQTESIELTTLMSMDSLLTESEAIEGNVLRAIEGESHGVTTENLNQKDETTTQLTSTRFGAEEGVTMKTNENEETTTTVSHMSEEASAELNGMISEEDETEESIDEDPYIKLGETTTLTPELSLENDTKIIIDNKLMHREHSVEQKAPKPIYPIIVGNIPIRKQPSIFVKNYTQPYEESDEEDEEDQFTYHESNLSNFVSTTTTSATSTTKSTTTAKPRVITTHRLNTLKPVSYFNKQQAYIMYPDPAEPLYKKTPSQSSNTHEKEIMPPKVASYIIPIPQQRPMQRPPQLSNLMISPTQATRSPVYLEPSPTNSKGLEASLTNLDEDILAFTKLCNELAFSYWKLITSEKISSARSLVISPFALTSMLSMVFLGARGSTSGEMNDVLKLDDMVTFNPHIVFKNITDSVEKSIDSHIATTAFVRQIYSDRANGKILQFFKEKTQQLYAGHVEEVNFHVVNDIIRRRTNLLVKRHTTGKVLEYLRTNSVWVNGPLATISANLFQTDCSYGSTQDRGGEIFFQVHPTIRQRRLVPIPAVLFKGGFSAGYEPNLDATVVAFGDIRVTTSTIYVMPGHLSSVSPSDKLDRLEKELMETAISKNAWTILLTSLMERPGMEVQIPRFSHRSFVNATLGLQKMGLRGLFKSDYADLGGLTGSPNRDIYISDMIQINTFSTCGEEKIADHHHVEMYPAPPLRKRNKDVGGRDDDEQDSSEDIIDFGSLVQDSVLGRGFYDDLLDPKYLELPLPLRPRQARVPDTPRLRFDKPFLYFVRHNPTGMILFMGRFNPRLLP